MVHDVVNVRCPDTKPALCALAAEGFAQNLRRSKIAFPFVGLVHPSPGLCLGAAPVAARPVCVAVTVAHQHAAAWVSARSQWLMAHGLSPPGKNKKPPPTLPKIWVCQQWLLSEHAPCSIFTMFDALHLRHHRTRFRASVSGRTACDVSLPQFGQTINPFFVSSLAVFVLFCNAFSSLSWGCP